MREPRTLLKFFVGVTSSVFLLLANTQVYADSQDLESQSDEFTNNKAVHQPSSFTSFTGKISKNKVRMRLQPSLDGVILREFARDDLVVVVDENEDFFGILPPADIKGYVYRTYILDNVVEGNKVNVRTEPDLEAPIIVQLHAGDRVEGGVSPLNSKWLEIALPSNARFYVCKEYVEKLGDASLMSRLQQRRTEVNQLLNSTYLISQSELQKPFDQIHLDAVVANYKKIIQEYSEFTEQTARAKELMSTFQDNYLQKKIAWLEQKNAPQVVENEGIEVKQQQIQYVEAPRQPDVYHSNVKMSAWIPVEEAYYQQWSDNNGGRSSSEFALEDEQQAVVLRGVIEPYTRPVKNKPGDYLLVNRSSHLPIAYLYSTEINLQDKLSQEVTIRAVSRPNNHFAFPAYKVLSVE